MDLIKCFPYSGYLWVQWRSENWTSHYWNHLNTGVFMSPVSPVFHTVVTVIIKAFEHQNKNFLTLQTVISFGRTRAAEAQFQIEAPDPFPPNKRRTDLGTLVVLSGSSSVTHILLLKEWVTWNNTNNYIFSSKLSSHLAAQTNLDLEDRNFHQQNCKSFCFLKNYLSVQPKQIMALLDGFYKYTLLAIIISSLESDFFKQNIWDFESYSKRHEYAEV